MNNILYIKQTPSTNELLWNKIREEKVPEGFIVHADFQMAGKGQLGNSWESKAGKNLLFSMVLYPQQVPPDKQFLLSQIVSIAIKNTLDKYVDNVTIKWPNDIYWNDKKIAGILIENSLQGKHIKLSVIGIGLNVNQTEFESNAPNPISLRQIVHKRVARKPIMKSIWQHILKLYTELDVQYIQQTYSEMLYRKDGFHPFKVQGEVFEAKIFSVRPDGMLELETADGEYRGFYFKEVSFVV